MERIAELQSHLSDALARADQTAAAKFGLQLCAHCNAASMTLISQVPPIARGAGTGSASTAPARRKSLATGENGSNARAAQTMLQRAILLLTSPLLDPATLEPPAARERADLLSAAYNNAALLHQRLGNYHTALRYLQLSAEVERSISGAFHAAESMINICAVMSNLGQHREAVRVIAQALSTLEQVEEPAGSVDTPSTTHNTPATLDRVRLVHIRAAALFNAAVECEHLGLFSIAQTYYEHCATEAEVLFHAEAGDAQSDRDDSLERAAILSTTSQMLAQTQRALGELRKVAGKTHVHVMAPEQTSFAERLRRDDRPKTASAVPRRWTPAGAPARRAVVKPRGNDAPGHLGGTAKRPCTIATGARVAAAAPETRATKTFELQLRESYSRPAAVSGSASARAGSARSFSTYFPRTVSQELAEPSSHVRKHTLDTGLLPNSASLRALVTMIDRMDTGGASRHESSIPQVFQPPPAVSTAQRFPATAKMLRLGKQGLALQALAFAPKSTSKAVRQRSSSARDPQGDCGTTRGSPGVHSSAEPREIARLPDTIGAHATQQYDEPLMDSPMPPGASDSVALPPPGMALRAASPSGNPTRPPSNLLPAGSSDDHATVPSPLTVSLPHIGTVMPAPSMRESPRRSKSPVRGVAAYLELSARSPQPSSAFTPQMVVLDGSDVGGTTSPFVATELQHRPAPPPMRKELSERLYVRAHRSHRVVRPSSASHTVKHVHGTSSPMR